MSSPSASLLLAWPSSLSPSLWKATATGNLASPPAPLVAVPGHLRQIEDHQEDRRELLLLILLLQPCVQGRLQSGESSLFPNSGHRGSSMRSSPSGVFRLRRLLRYVPGEQGNLPVPSSLSFSPMGTPD